MQKICEGKNIIILNKNIISGSNFSSCPRLSCVSPEHLNILCIIFKRVINTKIHTETILKFLNED